MPQTRTIEVVTKDGVALSDAEMGDMADLCAGTSGWGAGDLSKTAEAWVLASQAYEEGRLEGFAFSTLERIGGTPAIVLGPASIRRGRGRSAVLRSLVHEAFHRARMAFPDEDVIMAAVVTAESGFEIFAELTDVRPTPGVRVNGEERAWGRRLAKRYGADGLDERALFADAPEVVHGIDHDSLKSLGLAEVAPAPGRVTVAWGWALAEFLDDYVEPGV